MNGIYDVEITNTGQPPTPYLATRVNTVVLRIF